MSVGEAGQPKRGTAESAQTRGRRRRRAANGSVTGRKRQKRHPEGREGMGESGALALKSGYTQEPRCDISGAQTCPPELKVMLQDKLSHEERTTARWQFTFKEGESFEVVEFVQYALYGPPHERTRYIICCKLGEGSFSCVFKAWDCKELEFCAMKFTLSSAGKEEYNILAKLNAADSMQWGPKLGRNVVHAKDCFDCVTPHATVIPCIVMEYLPNVLTALLTAFNPFAPHPLGVRAITSIAKQLLQAAAFVHEQGHIHCDIKPQNILYQQGNSEDGKLDIRLADFGSCIVAPQEQTDYIDYIVTRPYRPPEVMLGLPLTAAADVWSCGCVIMELILGVQLFTSNDHFQLLTAMVELLGVPSNDVIERSKSASTFFCRPRALTCPEAFDHPPIPLHITVKRSRNKRSKLYYYDSDSNKSQFERPPLKAEDLPHIRAQLPSYDWQMRVSSSTANWYYANAKLGATQWQRPIRQSLRSKVESTIGPYFQVAAFCHLFSVVEKMLVWDPAERITAREAADSIT